MFTIHDCTQTILAKEKMLTLDTRSSRLNNNVMLVGATGRGKTRNVIKPNIMQMNSSFVISDAKGQLILELGDMLEAHGYRLKVLNLIDMEHSCRYNPFRYIKNDSDVYKLIDYVMMNVNPYFSLARDQFWDNASKALLSAICFYIYHECRKEDQNFTSVMKLLRCMDIRDDRPDYESTLDIMFRTLTEVDPEHIAVRQYAVFKAAAASPRTAASIAITTEVLLQWFNLPEYEHLTASDNMELEMIGKKKTALFVITSDTDRSKNWLAGVFYSQLFDVLCRMADMECKGGRLPIHVRFILDDFACTARIPDFDQKLAMIRSREISCIITIQDEAQLENAYGRAAKGIISNCDSYIFLGSSNIDSCNKTADRLADPEISGADIRSMEYDQCVVICGNEGGIYKKFDIRRHPRYDMIADRPESPGFDLKRKFYIALPVRTRSLRNWKTNKNKKSVVLKESLFDIYEEAFLYSIISRISNLTVHPHQQLRDVFESNERSALAMLPCMHCDFIIRDSNWNVLFGIEIDDNQHIKDADRIVNDNMKKNYFALNGIPLLYFTADEVRKETSAVVDKIIATANQEDPSKHILSGEIPVFSSKEKFLSDPQNWVKDFKRKNNLDHLPSAGSQ